MEASTLAFFASSEWQGVSSDRLCVCGGGEAVLGLWRVRVRVRARVRVQNGCCGEDGHFVDPASFILDLI